MKTMRNIGILSLLSLLSLTVQFSAFAQNTNDQLVTSSDVVGTTDDSISPAVRKELEALKTRIAQLEAELKKNNASRAPDAKSSEHAAYRKSETVDASSNSMGLVEPRKEAAGSQPTDAGQPAKAEPFAFADWTWLNGTPRTKTPAF